jgi:pyruvate carboxylase
METIVTATIEGTVADVTITKGDDVASGDLIVQLQ